MNNLNSLLLILSEIHIIKDNKMKKFIHVTKNSDVYLVGNSQICGFEGEYSGQKMNISYSKGASILDCLAECSQQFKAMQGKVNQYVISKSIAAQWRPVKHRMVQVLINSYLLR